MLAVHDDGKVLAIYALEVNIGVVTPQSAQNCDELNDTLLRDRYFNFKEQIL